MKIKGKNMLPSSVRFKPGSRTAVKVPPTMDVRDKVNLFLEIMLRQLTEERFSEHGIEVGRAQIEAGDVESVVAQMRERPGTYLFVHGYCDDSRELRNIEAVVRFARKLIDMYEEDFLKMPSIADHIKTFGEEPTLRPTRQSWEGMATSQVVITDSGEVKQIEPFESDLVLAHFTVGADDQLYLMYAPE